MRDKYIPKAPPKGVAEQLAAPVDEIWDNATDRYEGDELLAARTARAEAHPAARIALLEAATKEIKAEQKTLVEVVTETRVGVAKVSGQMDVLLGQLVPEKHKTERTRIDARKAVLVAGIGAVATVVGYLLGGCL